MLFNSLIFTVFLPLVFLVYWLLPWKFRNLFLLMASYYFYYSYQPAFLLLLLGTTGLDYFLARALSRTDSPTRRQLLLGLSLFSNLGVLFVFKYFVWIHNLSVNACGLHEQLLHQWIVPAGLSFYTFQSLSYILDVYRNKYKATDSLPDFLLFVSFFPHMVAGPIVRYHSLMPQLKAVSSFAGIDWASFAKLCIWGYFKKMVVADNLAFLVNPVFANVTVYSGIELFVAGALFLVQLYCDFSGYSDIATGVAKLFNVELSLNWRRPFFADSVRDFWKRYHISLTTWFRDYLYVGLGGNRVSRGKWVRNVVLVFLISGLWHGAGFTFIIWGLLHALFHLLEGRQNTQRRGWQWPWWIRRLYLLVFLVISFIAFRAENLADLLHIYKTLFQIKSDYLNWGHLRTEHDLIYFALLLLVCGLLLVKEWNEETAYLQSRVKSYRSIRAIFYCLVLCMIFVFGNFSANTFIYFQF